ncbi:unnamed protein product [Gadus morhua 'NCC']
MEKIQTAIGFMQATLYHESKIKVFADDSKLHKDMSSHVDRILLEENLLSVVNWAEANNMEPNEEKFQLLQHGKLPDWKQPYTLPSGQVLHGSDHVKDLGVYVDVNLTHSYEILQGKEHG